MEGKSDKKPNFVIIYCDDLGYGDLSCFGSTHVATPNIDALASSGIRFTNWYSNSPVCSPSRASLLTGRYPMRAGVPGILGAKRGLPGLPASELTLAELLKRHGYRTALFGKWHLGTAHGFRPNDHGFQEFFGFLGGCVDYYSHIFYWGQARGEDPIHDLWHNEDEAWENGRYLTELITEKAVAFIEKQEEPFFVYVAYNAPHYPMHAPKKYLQRFPNLSPEKRIMAAMISAVDDGVGDIIQTLKKTGKYGNTIVFFSSDNGPSAETRNWLDGRQEPYPGGSAGGLTGYKGGLFEGGIRVPAIISGPGRIPQGKTCHEMAAMMDIFPTFLEIAQADLPDRRRIDGKSICRMLTRCEGSPHEAILWEYSQQLAIRKGNFKLVLNGKLDFTRAHSDAVHLADLETDPGEKKQSRKQISRPCENING